MRPSRLVPLAALLFAGCAPVYIAPAVNAPFFSNEGQIQFGGHVGTNGVDGQIAVSPITSLGIVGAISGVTQKDDDSHFFGELGLGYYLPQDISSSFRLEFLGTLGYGRSRGESDDIFDGDDISDDIAEGNYLRAAAQFDIGSSTPFFDGGFVLRLAYVDYSYDIPAGAASQTNLFIEPMVVTRIGVDPIKFEAQFGFVIPTEDDGPETVIVHCSIGLRVLLDFSPEEAAPQQPYLHNPQQPPPQQPPAQQAPPAQQPPGAIPVQEGPPATVMPPPPPPGYQAPPPAGTP